MSTMPRPSSGVHLRVDTLSHIEMAMDCMQHRNYGVVVIVEDTFGKR